jgi:hypothetical protein
VAIGYRQGESADQELFIKKVKDLNLRNSIFVDITANESVSKHETFKTECRCGHLQQKLLVRL